MKKKKKNASSRQKCHIYATIIAYTFESLPLPFSVQREQNSSCISVTEHPLYPPSSPCPPFRSDFRNRTKSARAINTVCASLRERRGGREGRGRGGLYPTSRCYNGLGGSSVGSPSSQYALLCRSGLVHSTTRAALPLCTVCVHT